MGEVLEPHAPDFAALGRTVQGCVATRETKEGMKPPSEPQLFIGGGLKPLLPLYSLAGGAGGASAARN